MTATSAATQRLRRSSGRLLRHLGRQLTFRRYAVTPNWSEGKQTYSAAEQPVVKAWCSEEDRVVSRAGGERPDDPRFTGEGDRKVRITETVLVVEVEPFEAYGGLTDAWRLVDAAGVERLLANPVLNDDMSAYVVRYAEGGR
jgi:hypothetical protein